MPPAPTTKPARPSSIYSDGHSHPHPHVHVSSYPGLVVSGRKRASGSISPSASTSSNATNATSASTVAATSSTVGGGTGAAGGSVGPNGNASRTSFRREREREREQSHPPPSMNVVGYPSQQSGQCQGQMQAQQYTMPSTTTTTNNSAASSMASTSSASYSSSASSSLSSSSSSSFPCSSSPMEVDSSASSTSTFISDTCSSSAAAVAAATSNAMTGILSTSTYAQSQPQSQSQSQLHPHSVLSSMVAGPSSSASASSSSNNNDASYHQHQPQQQQPQHQQHHNPQPAQQPVTGSAVTRDNRLLFEDDYVGEVTEYMMEMEALTGASADLMDMQPELQWYMRPFLVDFLVEIHQQFRLRPEVLYLSLNIVDRYVSKRVVYKKHYQLVGCAALWIASKFEDAKDRVPTVRELADMCCKAYDETAFIQMEGHVLQTIGWVIGHPTAEAWLRLACMGSVKEETKTQHVARFVMEITLFHREFVGLKPSSVAAAALMLARFICGLSRKPSSGDHEEIMRIIQCLDVCFHDHVKDISQIVIDKYAPVYYSRASAVVKEWYASGKRYVYLLMPAPMSPCSSSGMLTPGLVPSWSRGSGSSGSARYGSSPNGGGAYSCSSSEAGDEMPRTPVTPVGYNVSTDPFLVAATAAGVTSAHAHSYRDFKENIAPHTTNVFVSGGVEVAGIGMGGKKQASHGSGGNGGGGGIAAGGQYAVPAQRMALNPVQANMSAGGVHGHVQQHAPPPQQHQQAQPQASGPVFPRTLRRLSN